LMREVAARCHARQTEFYIPTGSIIETLIEINPGWRERAQLWTYSRNNVHTGLVYAYDQSASR